MKRVKIKEKLKLKEIKMIVEKKKKNNNIIIIII